MTLTFPLQLDREHRVAGIFPCPTFKDKSTYIESSTKVYDDVSDPHGPGVVSKHLHSSETGWAVGLACQYHCQAHITPFVPRLPQLLPGQVQSSQSHLEIPLA